jgi:alginate O-acetyltransferase complex protein AlgI
MLFNSLEFAVFFPIVTILYFLLPQKFRVALLLVASCVFYMAFVAKYILILAAVILIDYTAGIQIERATGHRRRVVLIISLCANIGLLGFFKYFNFLNNNIGQIAHFIGWNYSISSLKIILPIGLSFHTFQSMSYTIEVYRGRFAPERSLLHFATYVMFYPQLVAGPIERPQNLLHQFREKHDFNWARFVDGAQLMLTGLFKKIVIADRAAILVNAVYAAPGKSTGAQLLVATYVFAIQIYCDFSGYSDIARGAARVMGFDLMLNFNGPYLATSIADFWRCWHISLSTWFRDYVYFPLGGNRRGSGRTAFNVAVVFLVSGLLHAVFMVVYLLTESPRSRLHSSASPALRGVLDFGAWLVTLNLVCIAWIFFRAASVSDAGLVVSRIFAQPVSGVASSLHPGLDAAQFAVVMILTIILLFVELIGRRKQKRAWTLIGEQPRGLRYTAYYAFGLAFIVLLLWSPEHTPQPFIYFQF